jgi:hypothetical protein
MNNISDLFKKRSLLTILCYVGHGGRANGEWKLQGEDGDSKHDDVLPSEVFKEWDASLGRNPDGMCASESRETDSIAGFAGCLLLFVHACYSGKWVEALNTYPTARVRSSVFVQVRNSHVACWTMS